MEKRLFLAIALSFLVLLTWSRFASNTYHIENKEVINKIPEPALSLPAPEPPPDSIVSLSTQKAEFNFIEPWAAIKEIIFKDYQAYKFSIKSGLFLKTEGLNFKKESIMPNRAVFVHTDANKQIIKDFIFSNSNYDIELNISVKNLSTAPLKVDYPLVLGVLSFTNSEKARFIDVAAAEKEKISHINGRKNLQLAQVKFLAFRDQYFCAIIEPKNSECAALITKVKSDETEVALAPKEAMLSPGEQIKYVYHIYLGPQDLKLISAVKSEWAGIIHYGAFDLISHILLQILDFAYRILHNWGSAVIVLSILIYLFLYPLTLKQMRSMKEMQILQPKILELQKTHKDNPQKLNREMMSLYREHKVNPFGGCLPLILQIPIFFALYQALIRSINLKGASFWWIKDLSEPDRLFILPASLPVIGNEINILPILMMAEMFIQQKFSMSQASGEHAQQQKMMLVLFPLMFGFIFYKMPAGLVLYWFINSTLTLIYQLKIAGKK